MTSFAFSYFFRDPGSPGASVVKNLPANAGDAETWVPSVAQEDPLEEAMDIQSIAQR